MFNVILFIHILFGIIAFISSPIALSTKKGGLVHRRAGSVFAYSMYIACIASFLLSILHPNIFLFIIGIFSFYLVASAHRILKMKKLKVGDIIPITDWMLASVMLLAGIFFIGFGIHSLTHHNMMGIVMIIFGIVGAQNAWIDIKLYRYGPTDSKFWILIHIGRMIGGMMAAFTAFLVVNYQFFPGIPGWILWLTPSVLLLPFTIYFSRRELKK